ncbi:5-oxoprolinase subunit PxpA [Haloechinothrix sp. LS1_15]|uniref:LamB/YcsF family protein n=1 Tax=Haloechinothrix sp. LS1_15 TaxID=2652248 RepID=UPI0029489E26|nr:5-oxoprolinase subunit PxpA [Haloechinothrix sp. LS1_15]MDV6013963.1 LamB/YcsF family protein [Haloechinothrix sp. LS1_15]
MNLNSHTGDDPPAIDLNCDLGEGFGRWSMADDDALLDVVSSANVACGFHAGDPTTMRRVCAGAVARAVTIGAHVGYRDLAGFGRRRIDVDPDELADEVTYQIGALDGLARAEGDRVRYVKPHGALYTTTVTDPAQAEGVVTGVGRFDATLPLLGLPGSHLLRLAERAGIPTVTEAFPDRGYTGDGHLVPRSEPGAVLHDADTVVERAIRTATEGKIDTIAGTVIDTPARSLCVHGDTPQAVTAARRISDGLAGAGVRLLAFAGDHR